jgi:hypothetical protein
VDKRSDIYSLGVMFFQMLTGRVPYDADSQVAIGIKHITEPVPFLPNHLRMFQPIINRVMAKDPNHRYQNGVELIKDLEKIGPADISMMDRILQQDIEATSKTDPHASTVLADIPTLNTGNVTTADAARMATRIGTGTPPPQQKQNKSSPLAAIAVIVIVVVGGAWFLTQNNTDQGSTRSAVPTALPPPASSTTESSATVAQSAPAPVVTEVEAKPAPVSTVTEATEENKNMVVAKTEQQAPAEKDVASVQAEDKKRIIEAAKAAELKKKQDEQAKAKQQAQVLAQQKQQQLELTKTQQARAHEIDIRMDRGSCLRRKAVMRWRVIAPYWSWIPPTLKPSMR